MRIVCASPDCNEYRAGPTRPYCKTHTAEYMKGWRKIRKMMHLEYRYGRKNGLRSPNSTG